MLTSLLIIYLDDVAVSILAQALCVNTSTRSRCRARLASICKRLLIPAVCSLQKEYKISDLGDVLQDQSGTNAIRRQ